MNFELYKTHEAIFTSSATTQVTGDNRVNIKMSLHKFTLKIKFRLT